MKRLAGTHFKFYPAKECDKNQCRRSMNSTDQENKYEMVTKVTLVIFFEEWQN